MPLIPQALKPGNTLYVVARCTGPTDVRALYAVAVTTKERDKRPTDDITMLITSFDAIREDVSRTRRFAGARPSALPPAHVRGFMCGPCTTMRVCRWFALQQVHRWPAAGHRANESGEPLGTQLAQLAVLIAGDRGEPRAGS